MRRGTLAHLFSGESASPGAAGRARGALLRLRGDKRGAAAIVTTMAATLLLGIAGLTVEVGNWYLLRRNMQAAADAAALAGALNLDDNKSTSGVEAVALSVTARNGFVGGQNGNTVTVGSDLTTGRVTVTVTRENSRAFLLRAAGFSNSTRTISARGISRVVEAGAPPCVLATNGPVTVNNNADISAGKCALASNSAATNAFQIGSGGSTTNGTGRITTANIVTHGGCNGCAESLGDRLTLTRSAVASSYAPRTGNAYTALDTWSPPATVSQSGCVAMPNTSTLAPGCYNSISTNNNSPVNLSPGVYYIRGGNLTVQGNLTCTTCTNSSGVSIVLVGTPNAPPGAVNINSSQANIDLNASAQPTQPALNGVLIYRHAPNGTPSSTSNGDISINGGANLRLDGAVVAPTSSMTMSGNAATDPTTCNIFVVASMNFKGNSNLSAEGCDLYGTNTNMPKMARLVE